MDLDVIQAIDDLIAKAKHGRGRKIEWFPDSRCGADVEMMLRSYGIKVYGRQLIDKQMREYLKGKRAEPGRNYGVTVRMAQAEWAEYLMLRSGLVVTSELIKPGHAQVQPGPMPEPWRVPAKPVGITGGLVAALMGEIRYIGKELNIKQLLK